MQRWVVALWVSAALMHAAHAAAQEPNASQPAAASASPAPARPATVAASPPSQMSAPVETDWYGWQILATDAASLALGLAIGAASDDEGNRHFGDVAASAWAFGMLGSLSVHAAHQNSNRGLAGISYRTMVPPMVSLLGLGFGCLLSGIADHCASDSARWGFVLGAVGTTALDAGLLAYERRPTEPRTWYGWQALVIDGASLTAGVLVTLRRDEPDRRKRYAGLAALPLLTGLLISPWVHAFHGRWGTALGDLALRAFGPALGSLVGLTGYCAATGGADRCIGDGAVYGLLGGTVLIAGIDILVLSRARSETSEGTHASGTAITPFAAPERGGVRAGLAGSF